MSSQIALAIKRLKIKAKFFKGLSDPTRLAILETLLDGEKSVSNIVEITSQSQSNVSNHLRCLLGCQLVKNRKEGNNVIYSIQDVRIDNFLKLVDQIISDIHQDIAACINFEE